MPSTTPLDTRLPEMFRSGRRLRGIFNGIPSPAIVEMCGYAGFDFVIIDNEHGGADFQATEQMLRAARASGIAPIVRCLAHDVSRVLDLGASGVMLPMVDSAAQAGHFVRMSRYRTSAHPEWARGTAFSTRAAGYGAFGGAAHVERSNEGIVLIAMIESPAGVAAIDEIAAIEGLDGIFVGPNDLSYGMGHQGRWNEAPVQQAIRHVLATAAQKGKCPGILALTPQDEEPYAAVGARFFATVTTSLFTKALADAARHTDSDATY